MQIQFTIFTKNDTDSKSLNEFLREIVNGRLKFNKFDYKEPVKQTINNPEEIVTMLTDYGNIILTGKNKSNITAWLGDEYPTALQGHFNLKDKGFGIDDVISLIEILAKDDYLLFAGIYSEDEFDLKHKIVKQYSYTWKGISPADFMEHIPGIYWYTIFGKELVQVIGKEKFKNLPNVTYTAPKDGCIAFHLNEPIESDDLVSRLSKENELANIIGKNYFFDKNEVSVTDYCKG